MPPTNEFESRTPPPEDEDEGIDRGETGIRILLTILFLFAIRVVETVLFLVVVFDLAYALITRREPSAEVQRFANRALTYAVAAVRYITYNDDTAPFPFAPFPVERDLERPRT